MHGLLDDGSSTGSWLDAAYHGRKIEENPLLYTETVVRLHDEVLALGDRLEGIVQLLMRME